jgi:hypothetical protein
MTIKRKIAAYALAVVCVIAACVALTACFGAVQTSRQLQVARAERPLSIAKDLTVASKTTHKIQRLHDLGHGMEVCLEIPGGFGTDSDARRRLAGLRGEISVSMDKGGAVVDRFAGTDVTVGMYEDVRGCVLLCRLQTHVTGAGEVEVKITDGAPSMAGVPVRFFLRNSYCGLEQHIVTLYWVATVVSAVVAILIGLAARSLARAASETPT